MSLDEVADELYRLPLPAFTATRDARAAEAARAGDRELAAAVKKLRKPTTGAWLANLLAHERPDDVGRLVDLGAALRSAQGRLAGDDLRRLSQERRDVVTALSAEATRLGRDTGSAVGESAVRELEETLEAALSDDGAAEVLRAGRLTVRLAHTGLGLGGVAAGGQRSDGPDATRLRQAREAAVEARRQATSRRAVRERAEREVERLRTRVDELEEELRSVRSEAEEARQALRAARAEEQRAERAERRAEADLRRLGG